MAAYVKALGLAVKPGSVVVDIGTGGMGIFALLASRFGARRVYAIEPSNAIQVAQEIARANGWASRIEFIQHLSTKVTLPERADVIVSDLRDVLPLFGLHIPTVIDARWRLLAPSGKMIPERDILWAAVAEAPFSISRGIPSWNGSDRGFDMRAAERIVTNTIQRARVSPEQLLVEPRSWGNLDYSTICSPDVSTRITWRVSREGTGAGLSVWFDTELTIGAGFSNAPHEPELIYGSYFLPWSERVELNVGDTVSVSIQANLIHDEYLWCWSTRVVSQDDPSAIKADFSQSSFFDEPRPREQVLKATPSYVPSLDIDGKVDHFILASMDGSSTLGDIAREAARKFPFHFANKSEALARVGKLSKRYSTVGHKSRENEARETPS